MKILLTGLSSFTGSWFARTLTAAGHEVYGTLQQQRFDYGPLQQARLALAESAGVHLLPAHGTGSEAFLDTLAGGFDVLCLHGAHVKDYRSPMFDVTGAVGVNTANLRQVVDAAKQSGVSRLIATGTVFEDGEGAGEPPLRAASPYGLAKSITWTLIDACCKQAGLPSAKLVIPNPFGPYEEPRFCAYLMKTWASGGVAQVNTPVYIRDNIPVRILASAYAHLVSRATLAEQTLFSRPSFYVERQQDFALRFAREIGARLNIDTPLNFATQKEFAEPLMRVNTDFIGQDWNESEYWDELAAYYRMTYFDSGQAEC